MSLGPIVLGLALLLAGRRLFWLFVAALGFMLATEFVAPLIAPNDPTTTLIVGLIAGVAGAVFAMLLQKLAIGLAGAFAGAYYLHLLAEIGSVRDPATLWISVIAGAVLGAMLLLFLFKWALVFFSSVAGAHLIVQGFDLSPGLTGAAFLALLIAGLLVQGRQLAPRRQQEF
jgi:uncharacterized membrane protein YeaQ/YmgE (transglycosylase-associated protein family)